MALNLQEHIPCFIGDHCYDQSGIFEKFLSERRYMQLTNRAFWGTFNKTLRQEYKEDPSTYCQIIILMFKDDVLHILLKQEKMVRLFENIAIKSNEIFFTDQNDFLKKLNENIKTEDDGKKTTYCELDFKSDKLNPFRLEKDFECIVVDNEKVKQKVEQILADKIQIDVVVSPLPKFKR